MRFRRLFLWDLRFQARYGFYLLYGFLTLLYAALLFSLPPSWREKAAAILIFSDPAAMGLFFMGAIVLLEKSQQVPSFFSVSPLREYEYVCSKVLSLSVIAMLTAMVLAAAAKCKSLPLVLIGTFLSNLLFALAGIIVAAKITSLNQFILATLPVEVLAFMPAILHLFGVTPVFFRIYPTNFCMDLIAGRAFSVTGLFFTLVLIFFLYFAASRCVGEMWQGKGGVKP